MSRRKKNRALVRMRQEVAMSENTKDSFGKKIGRLFAKTAKGGKTVTVVAGTKVVEGYQGGRKFLRDVGEGFREERQA